MAAARFFATMEHVPMTGGNMNRWLFIAPLALMLVALNLKASVALARANCYERRQKVIQFMLVWALPVAGGMLVWSLAATSSASETRSPRATDSNFEPNTHAEWFWTDASDIDPGS